MATVNDFLQLIYGALSQRGANLFITPTNTLRAVDLAVKDVLNYEGINWGFQLRVDDTFTTTGAGNTFVHTIPTSTTEFVRRVVAVEMNGIEQQSLSVKAIPRLNSSRDIYFRFGDSSITVFDQPGQPLTYTLSYFVGYKTLVSPEDSLPIPDFFLPALFDYCMSYLMLPFGQYGEGKDQNFYQRAGEKMAGILKSNSSQNSNLVINIK
jgi:hypothetical protein